MNAAFREVIAAGDDNRRDLFLTTARRLGTAVENVEKDFWVCWTLDALFNGLAAGAPRLLFKGGTSLSKSFGLIDRFSEDIDITVFRNDLGEAASVEELEALSGKKRRAKLDAIKAACQAFIAGPLLADIAARAADAMTAAQIERDRYRVELDAADPDQQTLVFWYPAATTAEGSYIPVGSEDRGRREVSTRSEHRLDGEAVYGRRSTAWLGECTPPAHTIAVGLNSRCGRSSSALPADAASPQAGQRAAVLVTRTTTACRLADR
jgi:Nucleotidyl transferase AbiEii toxin, Type IV TA system